MRNLIKRLLAGTAVLGVALSGIILGVGQASASTPVIYGAVANSWAHGYVEPGSIQFGMGGSPYIAGLHWTSWSSSGAWATGTLWTQQLSCQYTHPTYQCLYYPRSITVHLSTIRLHAGIHPYYARMDVTYYYGGRWLYQTGWFNGWWQFPAVPLYL